MYERSRSSGNDPPRPQNFPPRDVPLPTPSDPSECDPSRSLPPDTRERPSTPPEQLEWEPSPHVLSGVALVPSSNASVMGSAPGVMGRLQNLTVPSLTILPSIRFETIPCPLRLLIPPEYDPVSCVAGNDLDMTLYVLFSRSRKFHRGIKGRIGQPRKGTVSIE